MGSEAEPAKGLLLYLQHADELQKHEPLVAYYCWFYAMEKRLRIPQKEHTKTTNSILVSLMNQLKKTSQEEEAAEFEQIELSFYLEEEEAKRKACCLEDGCQLDGIVLAKDEAKKTSVSKACWNG